MSDSSTILESFYEAIERPIETLGLDQKKNSSSHQEAFIIQSDQKMRELLGHFDSAQCDSLIVIQERRPIGIITEQDLLKKIPIGSSLQENSQEGLSSEVMAQDVMTSKLSLLTNKESIKSAMSLMAKRKFRHIPIVDEKGDYLFTLDLMTIFRYIFPLFKDYIREDLVIEKWSHITVDNYESILPDDLNFNEMASHLELFFKVHLKRLIYHRPIVLKFSATIKEAIEILAHRSRNAVLITEFETQLRGILTERDLLRKFYARPDLIPLADELLVRDFMTYEPHMLLRKHTLGNALSNILYFNYRNIILVDEDKQPLSVIELMDIFKFLVFHLIENNKKCP
jgi:signal-transduction protein with cAMP-binding, CBS, and nucleotidyltransferase domain